MGYSYSGYSVEPGSWGRFLTVLTLKSQGHTYWIPGVQRQPEPDWRLKGPAFKEPEGFCKNHL